MPSKELAAKLVAALEQTCPGIRYDYSLRDIERIFYTMLDEAFCPLLPDTQAHQNSFGF